MAFSDCWHAPPADTQAVFGQSTIDVSVPTQFTESIVIGSVMLEVSNLMLPGKALAGLKSKVNYGLDPSKCTAYMVIKLSTYNAVHFYDSMDKQNTVELQWLEHLWDHGN